MSVEIYYGRNFIKVGDKCIPLVLHGSSNCTEYINGREVLERNWSTVNFPLLITREDIHDILSKFTDTYGEWFKRGSRGGAWISKDGFEKICLKAFDDARTIEEYVANGNYVPRVFAWKYEEHYEEKSFCYPRTTDEFLDWYKNYEDTLKEDGWKASVCFSTREQINIAPKTANKFPCIAKCKCGYLTDSTDLGNTWCKDISKAHIFNSQDEIDAVKLRGRGKISFVSSNRKTVEKPYALYCDLGGYGYYFKRKSSRHIFWGTEKSCKRFSSEKEALKYADTIFCESIKEKKVVRVG